MWELRKIPREKGWVVKDLRRGDLITVIFVLTFLSIAFLPIEHPIVQIKNNTASASEPTNSQKPVWAFKGARASYYDPEREREGIAVYFRVTETSENRAIIRLGKTAQGGSLPHHEGKFYLFSLDSNKIAGHFSKENLLEILLEKLEEKEQAVPENISLSVVEKSRIWVIKGYAHSYFDKWLPSRYLDFYSIENERGELKVYGRIRTFRENHLYGNTLELYGNPIIAGIEQLEDNGELSALPPDTIYQKKRIFYREWDHNTRYVNAWTAKLSPQKEDFDYAWGVKSGVLIRSKNLEINLTNIPLSLHDEGPKVIGVSQESLIKGLSAVVLIIAISVLIIALSGKIEFPEND